MLNIIFFAALALYFFACLLEFVGVSFKKDRLLKAAWILFLIGFALHTVYFAARGVKAGRVPLANQFEFAMAFSWGVAALTIVFRTRLKAEWLSSTTTTVSAVTTTVSSVIVMPSGTASLFVNHSL